MKTALSIIRKRCNYSQIMVADELQVSRQMIHTWENGNKAIPAGRITELAELFGVSEAMLTETDIDAVELWCDRPLYSLERQGKQVFSFSPTQELKIVITSPDDPMPEERCRQLVSDRNRLMQSIAQQLGFTEGAQAQEIAMVENCLSSLVSMRDIFQTAAQADEAAREQMLGFLSEQMSIMAQVLADKPMEQPANSAWQTQQLRHLRAHWSALNRQQADRRAEIIWEQNDSEEPPQGIEEMIDQWYRQARKQGISRAELQEHINRMILEEYENEKN